MKVGVEINSFFSRFSVKTGSYNIELESPIKVSDFINQIGIPKERIGFVIVNGKRVDEEYILNDGDKLEVIPYAMGG